MSSGIILFYIFLSLKKNESYVHDKCATHVLHICRAHFFVKWKIFFWDRHIDIDLGLPMFDTHKNTDIFVIRPGGSVFNSRSYHTR